MGASSLACIENGPHAARSSCHVSMNPASRGPIYDYSKRIRFPQGPTVWPAVPMFSMDGNFVFTVIGNDKIVVHGKHWISASTREIENRKPTMPQGHPTRKILSGIVRSPVPQDLIHRTQKFSAIISVRSGYPNNSAHSRLRNFPARRLFPLGRLFPLVGIPHISGPWENRCPANVPRELRFAKSLARYYGVFSLKIMELRKTYAMPLRLMRKNIAGPGTESTTPMWGLQLAFLS